VLIAESNDLVLSARGDELLFDGFDVRASGTDSAAPPRLADVAAAAVILGTPETPARSRQLRGGAIPRVNSRMPVLSTGVDNDDTAVRHYRAGTDIALPSTASPLLIAARLKGPRATPRTATTADAPRRQPDRRPRRAHRHRRRPTDAALTPPVRPLHTLACEQQTAHTRQQLAHTVSGDDMTCGRTIDSHIGRLRQKPRAAGAEPLVQNVRGVGYRLTR